MCVCVCVCVRVQSCQTLFNSTDCSPTDFSVHGISQARILEWVSISFSRQSSRPRDWGFISCVSCSAGGFFTCWASREALRLAPLKPNHAHKFLLKLKLWISRSRMGLRVSTASKLPGYGPGPQLEKGGRQGPSIYKHCEGPHFQAGLTEQSCFIISPEEIHPYLLLRHLLLLRPSCS